MERIIHTEDGDDLQNYSWSDEVEDLAVDIIWNKLKDGHCFKKSDWHSGLLHHPLMTDAMFAAEKKKNVPAPIPRKQGTKKQGTQIGDIPTTSKKQGTRNGSWHSCYC